MPAQRRFDHVRPAECVIGTRTSRINGAVKSVTRAERSLLLLAAGGLLVGCSSAPTSVPGAATGTGGSGSSAWRAPELVEARSPTVPLGSSTRLARVGSGRGPRPERHDRRRGWAFRRGLDARGFRRPGRDPGAAHRLRLRRHRGRSARDDPVEPQRIGQSGAEFHGGLRVDGRTSVIVRNLKVVGNNCSDSPTDCSEEPTRSASATARTTCGSTTATSRTDSDGNSM